MSTLNAIAHPESAYDPFAMAFMLKHKAVLVCEGHHMGFVTLALALAFVPNLGGRRYTMFIDREGCWQEVRRTVA